MAVGMCVDSERGLRVFAFSGDVTPSDFDFVAKCYTDRDNYRFVDREIVYFATDVSLARIDTEAIGALADSFLEALRDRDDVIADISVWVMPDQVRSDARLWREFSSDPTYAQRVRHLADDLPSALETCGLPAAWSEDVRHVRGFRQFGDVVALRDCLAGA